MSEQEYNLIVNAAGGEVGGGELGAGDGRAATHESLNGTCSIFQLITSRMRFITLTVTWFYLSNLIKFFHFNTRFIIFDIIITTTTTII